MLARNRRSPVWLATCLTAAIGTGSVQAGGEHAPGLLTLQATARMAVALAEGNNCAAIELRPRIEAALRYLSAAPGDEPTVDETIALLAATRYDAEPCDTPCPPPVAPPVEGSDETYGTASTARHIAALNAVVEHWQRKAESDPPVLSLAVSRFSHDPLPRYLPGQPVDFLVHVGPSCHGATLSLDRDYELPGSFDGSGSFVPSGEGLWRVRIQRHDGVEVTPLSYLEPRSGLPSYYREFWVGSDALRSLGPGHFGEWSRPAGEPLPPPPSGPAVSLPGRARPRRRRPRGRRCRHASVFHRSFGTGS